MDVKGPNPFLFTDDDYTSPNSGSSNPFLMTNDDFVDETSGNDNPFLSQTAATMAPNNSTNPFAFDPMDMGPTEAYPAEVDSTFQSTFNPTAFMDATSNVEPSATDIMSATVHQDLLSGANVITGGSMPQKPTDLDLKYTNSVAISDDNLDAFDLEISNHAPTSRPLPPRPPPSKETQDLLMSVMGAMDATSSHLLDRIPPTRTPSPVSMRDLHSPSPTPEPTFGDLLDVSDSKPEAIAAHENNPSESHDLLLSLDQNHECDINQNPPLVEQVVPPQRPGPPARPPRPPAPPQKPPPPVFAQPTNILGAPPKPPPPIPVHAQVIPEQPKNQSVDEMMDMFGSEDLPPQKPTVSTSDIMNLYNAPAITKPATTVADLLFDTVETTVTPEIFPSAMESENVEANFVTAAFDDDISEVQANESFTAPTSLVQDNFLSPEPSQSELQMDTSDSQSKGSVSSVTFNPFAGPDESGASPIKQSEVFLQQATLNATSDSGFQQQEDLGEVFGPITPMPAAATTTAVSYSNDFGTDSFRKNDDTFDAFTAKFESAAQDENKNGAFDAFSGAGSTWGNDASGFNDGGAGFGGEESFDAFLAMKEPPAVPQSTPSRYAKSISQDSDEEKDFSVFIRPKAADDAVADSILPVLAPPPAAVQNAFTDSSPRFNPFDQSEVVNSALPQEPALPIGTTEFQRSDSQETPPTPLFDDDVSQPLQPFPRLGFAGDGWEMHLRQPNKKKITGQRFWKKIFVRLVNQGDCILLQLFNQLTDKDPFQELPLQPCYSVSDIGAQQYDNFGKIFTVKLQYIFYKERPGVRPGQVKKAERITNKLSQFAAYAIQGDYQGVKEFGSDLKKLGLPVEHAPQVSQLMKLGSLNYEDLKQFSICIEEALFNLQAHRDRALHYKMEEVQITAVDELYVEQDGEGHVECQIARVRLFFLGFLTGMPDVELGVNDMRRQGKEVVGRHDIIPVVTEEWIRLEEVEFHSCVDQEEYSKSHILKFKPPDACYIELLRFRIRPPKNRELPLQLKPTICITGNRIELRADVLVPGFASRKLGQVPCEDVMIRFPIPECWIYLFRVEKHFRYGSVKSAHRRTGKIKGIERILGTVDTLQESLIEVTSGQAKYEHQHRAIVWRCPRLPKEGQGAYTTHNMVCRMALTSYDQMPEQLAEYCYVEFTMPATQASHTTVRSVSLQNSDSDEPPEKYVRYLARHEYRVGIEHAEGQTTSAYDTATFVTKPVAAVQEEPKPVPIPEADSSSDSD